MQTDKSVSPRLPTRLTGISQTVRRLKSNHYTVLRMLIVGELDGEIVDGEPKVSIASIERIERSLAQGAG
jgi:hypothetical protein